MKLIVYSIFDEKGKSYSRPFFMHHHGEALRAFQDLVMDQQSMISRHPEDYKLYVLGMFSDISSYL